MNLNEKIAARRAELAAEKKEVLIPESGVLTDSELRVLSGKMVPSGQKGLTLLLFFGGIGTCFYNGLIGSALIAVAFIYFYAVRSQQKEIILEKMGQGKQDLTPKP